MGITTPELDGITITTDCTSSSIGVLYAGVHEESGKNVLVQTIAPAITNSENFVVRFELLRRLLPDIEHPNLVRVLALGCFDNIYYLAKELSEHDWATVQTLADFDLRDSSSRSLALEQLLLGIAEGLAALESVRDSFHRNGIVHDALRPDGIIVTRQRALVGNALRTVPKIDRIGERFLYFGEGPLASARYRFARDPNLWAGEDILPPAARRGEKPEQWWHQYAFASIAYQLITHRLAKGYSEPVNDLAPWLADGWKPLLERCFASPYGEGYGGMSEIVDAIRTFAQREEALPSKLRHIREHSCPEGMVLIALEEKVILGNAEGPPEESPLFKARLKPFLIDQTVVSNAQFEAFMPGRMRSSYTRADDAPATLVPWFLAQAYCDWRSEQEGLPKGSYRLPTEYEWEAAARGATGEQYPWGATFESKYCHCDASKETGAIAVKARPPARFGIYQMLGNVWEWTHSPLRPHPLSKHHDPRYSRDLFVVKGGCWITPAAECRASARAAFPPGEARANVGFRCVRVVDDS